MRFYPCHNRRRVVELDGIWDFAWLGDADPESVDLGGIKWGSKASVPSCFDAMPDCAGFRGVGAYRRTVRVPPGVRSRLVCGGGGINVFVRVDGKTVASSRMPYSPVRADIAVAKNETREIVILCDNRFDLEKSPMQEKRFDFHAYGGIFRSVALHVLPDTFIEYAHVRTADLDRGSVHVDMRLGGTPVETAEIRARLGCGASFTRRVGVRDGVASFEFDIADSKPWSPASPHLYELSLECGDDDIVVRFGLRTVEARDGEVFLNGKPIRLFGFNRHEAHPQFGPALPLQVLVSDLQMLKSLNANFVRGAHYPQDQRFLDLCDEMGFLVWEESIGWGLSEARLSYPLLQDLLRAQTAEMVRTSFNHPSVVIWGFLNECESGKESTVPLYRSLISLVREADPSRLVTFASNRYMADLLLEELDLVCFNIYPGWYAKDMVSDRPLAEIAPEIREYLKACRDRGLSAKPFILSEIGAVAIYGWHDPLNAFWTEEYQRDCLLAVCDEFLANRGIAGLCIWHFCDCRTYNGVMCLKRPRGFNDKGVIDEFRRQKLSYFAIAEKMKGLAWHPDLPADGRL